MAKTQVLQKRDAEMRLAIYRFTIQRGHVPKASELAPALSRSTRAVRAGFQRLADAHILVLPGAVLGRANKVPGRIWQTRLVGQLRVGCSRHSCDAAPPCAHHHGMWLLRFCDDTCSSKRETHASERRDSFRRSCSPLVRQRRVHMTDHVALPVGRTRFSLVQDLEAATRCHSDT